MNEEDEGDDNREVELNPTFGFEFCDRRCSSLESSGSERAGRHINMLYSAAQSLLKNRNSCEFSVGFRQPVAVTTELQMLGIDAHSEF